MAKARKKGLRIKPVAVCPDGLAVAGVSPATRRRTAGLWESWPIHSSNIQPLLELELVGESQVRLIVEIE